MDYNEFELRLKKYQDQIDQLEWEKGQLLIELANQEAEIASLRERAVLKEGPHMVLVTRDAAIDQVAFGATVQEAIDAFAEVCYTQGVIDHARACDQAGCMYCDEQRKTGKYVTP